MHSLIEIDRAMHVPRVKKVLQCFDGLGPKCIWLFQSGDVAIFIGSTASPQQCALLQLQFIVKGIPQDKQLNDKIQEQPLKAVRMSNSADDSLGTINMKITHRAALSKLHCCWSTTAIHFIAPPSGF